MAEKKKFKKGKESKSKESAKVPSKEKKILQGLQPTFDLLRLNFSHDFSRYKYNTICRRIEKRMLARNINTMATYTRYLKENPSEVAALYKDLLINVTSFFRDPEAFEMLRRKALKSLLKNKLKHDHVRIWVPACSTGEEVYSLAILFQECIERMQKNIKVQIFGTDIDETTIVKARAGIYSLNIEQNISPGRLKRFFTREGNDYKINKEIRQMVVFAQQNLIQDPPFTKLDMISCRNLLIYLTPDLQKKIIQLFHYSLNPNGILLLGSSENIGDFLDLFKPLDKKWKIFLCGRLEKVAQPTPHFVARNYSNRIEAQNSSINTFAKDLNIREMVERVLLEDYMPIFIVIDKNDEIIYTHGKVNKYFEPSIGVASLNILQMTNQVLKPRLASALHQVSMQHEAVTFNNISIKIQDKQQSINLKVMPLNGEFAKLHYKIVIIEELKYLTATSISVADDQVIQQISFLENELKQTKANLHAAIREVEYSNEELKSSNEELQSTNEELQSTNEELETSKEELQSLNEELTSLNGELEGRIEELSNAKDDVQNLLYSTNIAVIFLDRNLRIKSFTPKATELSYLISSDVGRPITDIVSRLKYDKLIDDAKEVLSSLITKNIEAQDTDGFWYIVRFTPYRTVNNVVGGVVITFLNLDEQKRIEKIISPVKNINKIKLPV